MHAGKLMSSLVVGFRAGAFVVLVGAAMPTVAEDLIGPLQSELILSEGTMQATGPSRTTLASALA